LRTDSARGLLARKSSRDSANKRYPPRAGPHQISSGAVRPRSSNWGDAGTGWADVKPRAHPRSISKAAATDTITIPRRRVRDCQSRAATLRYHHQGSSIVDWRSKHAQRDFTQMTGRPQMPASIDSSCRRVMRAHRKSCSIAWPARKRLASTIVRGGGQLRQSRHHAVDGQ